MAVIELVEALTAKAETVREAEAATKRTAKKAPAKKAEPRPTTAAAAAEAGRGRRRGGRRRRRRGRRRGRRGGRCRGPGRGGRGSRGRRGDRRRRGGRGGRRGRGASPRSPRTPPTRPTKSSRPSPDASTDRRRREPSPPTPSRGRRARPSAPRPRLRRHRLRRLGRPAGPAHRAGRLEGALATVLRLPTPCGSTWPAAPTPACTPAGRSCTSTCRRRRTTATPARRWAAGSPACCRRTSRVRDVGVAPAGFDARFSPLSRRYAYRVSDAPVRARPAAPARRPVAPAAARRRRDERGRRSRLLGRARLRGVLPAARGRDHGPHAARAVDWARDRATACVGRRRSSPTRSATAWCARWSARCSRSGRAGAPAAGRAGAGRPACGCPTSRSRRPHGLTLEEVRYPPDDELADAGRGHPAQARGAVVSGHRDRDDPRAARGALAAHSSRCRTTPRGASPSTGMSAAPARRRWPPRWRRSSPAPAGRSSRWRTTTSTTRASAATGAAGSRREGYLEDAFDPAALRRLVLDPRRRRGRRRCATAAYDLAADQPVDAPTR